MVLATRGKRYVRLRETTGKLGVNGSEGVKKNTTTRSTKKEKEKKEKKTHSNVGQSYSLHILATFHSNEVDLCILN